jgi:hypothetical protein
MKVRFLKDTPKLIGKLKFKAGQIAEITDFKWCQKNLEKGNIEEIKESNINFFQESNKVNLDKIKEIKEKFKNKK